MDADTTQAIPLTELYAPGIVHKIFKRVPLRGFSLNCEPPIPAPADARVFVSPDLIQLERDGQLLLMDGTSVRPLLVTEGRDKVLDFLKLCAAAGRREVILAQINDPLLLDALMDHGIVRSGASTKASPRPLEP